MITEKLINQFIVFLYEWHIDEYGESVSSLPEGGIHVLDKVFPNECPKAVINLDKETIKDLTHNLANELKARGLVEYESLVVTLTPKGFLEAKHLKYPVKYFLKNKWHIYIPITLTAIAVFTTIIRLTKCA